jgi:hypothetical protein
MLRVLPFVIGIVAVLLLTGHLEIIFKIVQGTGQMLWPYIASFLQSFGGSLQ